MGAPRRTTTAISDRLHRGPEEDQCASAGDASEDDQIVPYVAEGPLSAKLLKHSTFKSYKDLPHGMPTTPTRSMRIFLAFLKS